jgi:hypothetical protein
MGSYMEIFEVRVLGGNLYLHQRFKVEYFLYVIQIILQYTPSFNTASTIMIITNLMHKNIQIYISMFTEVIT